VVDADGTDHVVTVLTSPSVPSPPTTEPMVPQAQYDIPVSGTVVPGKRMATEHGLTITAKSFQTPAGVMTNLDRAMDVLADWTTAGPQHQPPGSDRMTVTYSKDTRVLVVVARPNREQGTIYRTEVTVTAERR